MGLISGIIYVILLLLGAVFLELNHHTLFGWGLFAAAAVLFFLLYKKTDSRIMTRLFWWAGFLISFILIVLISWPPMKRVPAVPHSQPEETAVRQTVYGKVTGVLSEDGKVEVYAGIPYAAPPVGPLRWRKPQEPEPWEGVLKCDHFAPMSMQSTNLPVIDSLTQIIGYHDYRISLKDNYRPAVSEDSLYLNIWKPAGEEKNLPVVVYIHGGSLQTGQPWYADYSGEGFAKSGVITVNMGYRLGVFGFYGDEDLLKEDGTTGNYGLLDQIQALKWVRDNIAYFGGDPSNVTLIGESAGAVCVDALCVSPLAEGLFERAVLQSSTLASADPPHSWRTLQETLSSGMQLKERYHCGSADELREISAEKLAGEMNTQHHVTADGYVLPASPYELRKQGIHNEKALLHGFNAEESGPFIIFSRAKLSNYEDKIRQFFGEYADEVLTLYPAETDAEADENWARIYGAVFFNYSHYCLTRLAEDENIPVWQYRFAKKNGRLSDWHSGELVYAFGMIPDDSDLYDESDRQLSKEMHEAWVRFAKTGDPGFPAAERPDDLFAFSGQNEMIRDPDIRLYEILDRMNGTDK